MQTSNTLRPTSQTKRGKRRASIMQDRHAALAPKYRESPQEAWIVDIATTGRGDAAISDPLHSDVTIAGHTIPLGVHRAVGGEGDAPIPGEILSAALASCMDSTVRIIANRLGIRLTHLEVTVSAEVDVRGTLRFALDVPVAFQKMHLSVDIETVEGTKPHMVDLLLQAAEASCVVMQTLKAPPQITTQYNKTVAHSASAV